MKSTICKVFILSLVFYLAGCYEKQRIWVLEGPESPPKILSHDLSLEIDPTNHTLKATDQFQTQGSKGGQFFFFLNKNLSIESLALEGTGVIFETADTFNVRDYEKVVDEGVIEAYGRARLITFPLPQSGDSSFSVTVAYRGIIYDTLGVARFSRGEVADQTTGLIGDEGVYLSPDGFWYPKVPESFSTFKVTSLTPVDFETVTQGKRILHQLQGDKLRTVWEAVHPSDGLYFIAGRYEVTREDHNGVMVYAFFFPEERELVPQYIGAVKRYLDMYSRMLGPYPYAKFAVVENFFPTGYGMPSYTLLGRAVIRLPFIVYTSLGHEVLHNWWGNSVFVNYATGNWCEGLTTYLADYYYKEQQSPEAAEGYRKGLLKDYYSYVNPDNDFPLIQFRERTTPATRAVGYGKAAMVFHMMRKMIGDQNFFLALKNIVREKSWQKASWADFQRVFEEQAGEDFSWFFRQWVTEGGAPTLVLKKVDYVQLGGVNQFNIHLTQEGKFYRLLVPIRLTTESGSVDTAVWHDGGVKVITLETKGKPISLEIDPDFDIFRRLDRGEIAPTLSLVLGDKNQLIILPTGTTEEKKQAYAGIAGRLGRTGEAVVVPDTGVTEDQLRGNSFLLLGGPWENRVVDALGPPSYDFALTVKGYSLVGREYKDGDFSVMVARYNPWNPDKGVVIYAGLSPAGISAAGGKLIHYGKYSYLAFDGGKNVAKGIWRVTESPLVYRFKPGSEN